MEIFFEKKNTTRPLLEEKPLYIESEKEENAKSVKNVDISIVLEIFICDQMDTLSQGVKKTRRTLENKGRDEFLLILIIYRNNKILKKALKPLIILGLWRFFRVDR